MSMSVFKKVMNKPQSIFKKASGAVESAFKKGSNIAQNISRGLGTASNVLREGQGMLKSGARVIEKVSQNPLVRAGVSQLPFGGQALVGVESLAQGLRAGGKLLGQGGHLAGKLSNVSDVSSYKKGEKGSRVDTMLENMADAKRRMENKGQPLFA